MYLATSSLPRKKKIVYLICTLLEHKKKRAFFSVYKKDIAQPTDEIFMVERRYCERALQMY